MPSLSPAGADWTAAAVPVADKLWVVGVAHRTGSAVPLAAVIGCAVAGAAFILGGLVIVLRRGRRDADVEAERPAAAVVASPPRPPLHTPPGHAPGTPPQLTVVPRLTPAPPSSPGRGLAAATALAAEGGQQFGRYRLIERIGEGGMAEVFTAMLSGAEGFERMVVIKRLRPHLALNPEAVAQFIDEAKMGSVLTHSNIVTVSDFGKVGEGYYLAQEFVDGRTLAQIAARYREKFGRSVPAAIVFHVVHEVLAGIGYAHERTDTQGRPLSIVHRDVSPTNIMISFEGEVKLLDFGIVKAAERVSKTREGNVKGNVGYMSPEQARGHDVSTALGSVFARDRDVRAAVRRTLLSGRRRRRDPVPGRHRSDRRPPRAHRQAAASRPGHPASRAGDGPRQPLHLGARLRPRADRLRDDAEGPARRDDANPFQRITSFQRLNHPCTKVVTQNA